MDNRKNPYGEIEASIRLARTEAKLVGDDFLAYLLEIALLDVCSKSSDGRKTSGEVRVGGDNRL